MRTKHVTDELDSGMSVQRPPMGPLDPVLVQADDLENLLRYPPGYVHIATFRDDDLEPVYVARVRRHDGSLTYLGTPSRSPHDAAVRVDCAYSAMFSLLEYTSLYDVEHEEVYWCHQQLESAIRHRQGKFNAGPPGVSLVCQITPGVFEVPDAIPEYMLFPALIGPPETSSEYVIAFRLGDRYPTFGATYDDLNSCLARIRYFQVRAAYVWDELRTRSEDYYWRQEFDPPKPLYG